MDKTLNINLGGISFQIDEEGYKILSDYLRVIDKKFRNAEGGNETIEDIESRIAEIFQSQKGSVGVIARENVEAMISIIGNPDDFGESWSEGNPAAFSDTRRKKLSRNQEGKIIGGVCSGIGAYLQSDAVWFRIMFVLLFLMAGAGLMIYLALWIALPGAATHSPEKRSFGIAADDSSVRSREKNNSNPGSSEFGNAVNEIFRALWKVLFIAFRAFLILIGIAIVLTGFLALLTLVIVFIFKYPGAFSGDVAGFNLSYFPDILNYIVNPKLVPWIITLFLIFVSLPLIFLIYGGIRLIFWFRAKDGFFLLSGLLIWVMSGTVLSIILFNEGIGFTEHGKTTSQHYFKQVPDTIYVLSGSKIADLQVDKEMLLSKNYNVYISDVRGEISIPADFNVKVDADNSPSATLIRQASGRSKSDALSKAEKLQYKLEISGDTLTIDEFFTIPSDCRWSLNCAEVTLNAPEGTIIFLDKTTEKWFHPDAENSFVNDPENRYRKLTENGLSGTGQGKKR